MTRELVLPTTCEQLKKVLLVTITIVFISSLIQSTNWDNLNTEEQKLTSLGVGACGIGSFIGWALQLIVWDDKGVFRIRCRCKND